MTRVRPAAPHEYDAWYPLWRGYQAFYETDIAPVVSEVTWERFHDPAEPMHCAFAVDAADRPVRLVHLVRHRSCWTIGDYCYLQDLFVAAGLRGGGVGRALIEYAYAWAGENGCSRVHWLTQEDNATARRLYDRIADLSGFIQYRKLL